MAHSAMKDMWEMRMKATERREGWRGRGGGGERRREEDERERRRAYENDVCVTAGDIDAPGGH